MIPNDPNGAWYTSGLRLGTPAMTTLGMGADEMQEIAAHRALGARGDARERPQGRQPSQVKFETDAKVVAAAQARVADLLARYPLYPGIDLE